MAARVEVHVRPSSAAPRRGGSRVGVLQLRPRALVRVLGGLRVVQTVLDGEEVVGSVTASSYSWPTTMLQESKIPLPKLAIRSNQARTTVERLPGACSLVRRHPPAHPPRPAVGRSSIPPTPAARASAGRLGVLRGGGGGAAGAARNLFYGAGVAGAWSGRCRRGPSNRAVRIWATRSGRFAFEPAEEDLADLAPQVQGDAAQVVAPGLAGALHYRLDLLRRVVDPGHRGAISTPESIPRRRSSATASSRAPGSASAARSRPGLLVERRHGEVDRDRQALRAIRSKISMSRSASGDLVRTETGVSASSSAARSGHHPEAALDPLVGSVSVPSATSSRPARPRQLRPQQLRHVDLDDDLALEVPPRVEAQIGVRRTSDKSWRPTTLLAMNPPRPWW